MTNDNLPPRFDIEDPPTEDGIQRDLCGTMPFMRAIPSPPIHPPAGAYAAPQQPQQEAPMRSRAQTMDPRFQSTYGQAAAMPFARAQTPSSPVPVVQHDPRAGYAGLGAASNAAVDRMPPPEHRLEPQRPMPVRSTQTDYLDLVWFDPAAPTRAREQAAWADVLRDPPKSNDWVVGDEAERPQERGREERHVRRALSRVVPVSPDAIHMLVAEAIDEDGVLERPLCVVGGDLHLAFDPIETLRATVAASTHFAALDKKLKETIDAANEVLAEQNRVAASFLDSLSARIRAAFVATPRGLAPDYLDTTVERMLLEERKYLRRSVLGGPHIFAELYGDGCAPLPTYLPAQLSEMLPLFRRFRVRLLAEPHPPQDPGDTGQVALKVLALARVVSRRR